MFPGSFRPGVALLSTLWAAGAFAQPVPSLRQAADAAWLLNPQARAAPLRQQELDARARAASSLISGSPSIGIAQRSDRIGTNGGLRETDAEVSAPIWWPGVRRAASAQVDAERVALEHLQSLGRAQVAAAVRDLAAQAAIARIERDIAARKVDEARAFAADVARRVRAGDSARVDQLQAEGLVQQALSAATQADSALMRALAQWKSLTGLESVPLLDEPEQPPAESPVVRAAQAQVQLAQARLQTTEADRADPPEVGVGFTRERSAFGASTDSAVRFSVRLPIGTQNRNAPRLAAARAELAFAQAEADAASRSVQADRASAAQELKSARQAEVAAAQRARNAAEVQALVARAFRLGESDFPTRLRAEAERFDAQLAHARAQVETRRAISRLNQANGVQP